MLYSYVDELSALGEQNNMSVRGLGTVVIGVVAYVVIDNLITSIITGTDTGSVLIQSLLRIIVASAIIIGVVKGMGGGK